jgi:A/G-specific adenine glycosylase
VRPKYDQFLAAFPSLAALASAPLARVLAAWQGLGYNRRAVALQRAAREVLERHAGRVPEDAAALERLPGIGPYTARALASLAFGEPVGVVDTNVRRWLVRRFGLAASAPPRQLQPLADALAAVGDAKDAAAWTHATMEFGAGICRPRNPACDACPISAGCPSRGRSTLVPAPRQARFAGSDRAHRGAVIRALTEGRRHAITMRRVRRMLPPGAVERVIGGLERDGLAHRAGDRLVLGGRPEPVATIGA